MAEKLTPQQLQAVTDRGGNLLVSAAAGSGKTKVLVDRLMRYLTDPVNPANIDEFLIITYTKAAAAELRGKIGAKLSELIAQEPENRHLRQQMQRLYLTKISTVHAFCADVLREYAYMTDIPVDFRIAEENECVEIQAHVNEKLLDDAYTNAGEDADFYELINTQGLGRDDRQIPEILLKVYNSSRCHLDPAAWLSWCESISNVDEIEDVSETIWGKYLIDDLHQFLDLQIDALTKCAVMATETGEMQKPADLLYSTADQLRALRASQRWDDILDRIDIDFGRLNFGKKCSDTELVAQIKVVRELCKKGLAKKARKFSDCSEQILADMRRTSAAQRGLLSLVRTFTELYGKAKRSRRIMDFGDLEQRTLDLFMGIKRGGITTIAVEIGNRFREVMVDEYQDSNAVQDAIFAAITNKKQNCFMVGDVKQSIYQFRLADPDIFVQKYNDYVPAADAKDGQGRKIMLSNNFRSSGGVIDAVNDVFATCMSKQVGGLDYGADEALYEGIPHISLPEAEVELHAINVQEDTYEEEATFVANRICQLLDGSHMVRHGDSLRAIKPDDIVILLRSPGSAGEAYCRALEACGIRYTTGSGTDLLHTEEVEVLRAMLQVIDNPLQDIPLIALLSSRVFCFTADELAQIRADYPSSTCFNSLRSAQTEKATKAVQIISALRAEARINGLPKLLRSIFAETRMDSIYASLPDGVNRRDNLQAFYQIACDADAGGVKGLNRFLDYLMALEAKGINLADDRGSTGAVTIMSIHKSKGLEFPVVFLCGLSRDFNQESLREQILCDKDLGLGLSCVDTVNRIRYPSLAKRAIAVKMTAESVSEELRVLYVAMTRARDRLIMTYAAKNLEKELHDISARMDICDRLLLTGNVNCPGKWVLYTALRHTEATALFALCSQPAQRKISENAWMIAVHDITDAFDATLPIVSTESVDASTFAAKFGTILSFCYPYTEATAAPSKQTATQLKGRMKDDEIAEDAADVPAFKHYWRQAAFKQIQHDSGKAYGTAMHAVIQHIDLKLCATIEDVEREIGRLVQRQYISQEQGAIVSAKEIHTFFSTDLGRKICASEHVLREFKFSILDDGSNYGSGLLNDKVLLQGVVDCAVIEDDGITVIDFKTDRVSEETLDGLVDRYRIQIDAYASALSRIYKLPIKAKMLYFFGLGKSVAV